jgi:nucleotide-binding universal stress UspA family protein
MLGNNPTRSMHILLADDGSPHSQAAIQLLCDLPLPPDAHITAVSVFTPLQVSDHEVLRKSLDATKACLYDKGMHIDTEFMLGYPAEKIVEIAEDLRPDLIILGAKGLRATFGILLGGVAQQVVEYARFPVLIVRAPHRSLNHILFATDGSQYSQRASEYLLTFPLPKSASLHILHVLPPVPLPIPLSQTWPPAPEFAPPLPMYETEEIKKMVETQNEQGIALVEQTTNLLRKSGLATSFKLCRGDAATEIIEYIKNKGIDLVVIGSRGLGSVRGWLLGSVSRKIIHYSGCSVLVVKE